MDRPCRCPAQAGSSLYIRIAAAYTRFSNSVSATGDMPILPILTYHSIDSSGSLLSTPPDLLARQMQHLAAKRFRTLTVSEAAALLQAEENSPEPRIALTFDDGCRSVLESALPILRRYGFRGTLFAVSGFCGSENAWDRGNGSIPRFQLLNVDEIRGLAAAGWEIGSHSATHARLTTLSDASLEQELQESRRFLQEACGTPVRCLAYPYGAHDARVRRLARAIFDAACTTELDYARGTSDPMALQRIDAYYLRVPDLFRGLESGWMSPYLRLRRLSREVRGR